MDVPTTVMAGWFLVIGSQFNGGITTIPVPYTTQEKCEKAGMIAVKAREQFTCVPTDPDSVKVDVEKVEKDTKQRDLHDRLMNGILR